MTWRKNLIFLPSLWSDDIDIEIIEVFQNSKLTKKAIYFDQQRHWQKSDVNRRLMIDFFLLATKTTYRKIFGRF